MNDLREEAENCMVAWAAAMAIAEAHPTPANLERAGEAAFQVGILRVQIADALGEPKDAGQ